MRGAEFGGGALLASPRRACVWQASAMCRRGGPSCGGPRTFVQVLQVLRALSHGRAGLSVRWRPAHRSAQGSKATRARAQCAVCRNARTLATARTWPSAPALRVRTACAAFVLWPRLASVMRPMPAAAVAALVARERPLGAVGFPTLCCLRKHGPP
jgi:hypothetical protein